MILNIKQKQYILYAGFLLATVFLVATVYPSVNREWIYYRKAEKLFISGQFSKAIPFYRQAIDAGITIPKASIRLGDALIATKHFTDALKVFEKTVSLSPDIQNIKRLAALYDQKGSFDEAIALYEQHKSLGEADPGTLIHLADLYKNKKEFNIAKTYYKRVLILDPNSFSARFKLAEILSWSGSYDEAIDLYRAILRDNPRRRLSRILLARVLSWNGQFEEAILEYRKVLGESS